MNRWRKLKLITSFSNVCTISLSLLIRLLHSIILIKKYRKHFQLGYFNTNNIDCIYSSSHIFYTLVQIETIWTFYWKIHFILQKIGEWWLVKSPAWIIVDIELKYENCYIFIRLQSIQNIKIYYLLYNFVLYYRTLAFPTANGSKYIQYPS